MANIKTPDGSFYLEDTDFEVDYENNVVKFKNTEQTPPETTPLKIIDLGNQKDGVEFPITAEQYQIMREDCPPIVTVGVSNFKTNLVRFDMSANAIYYANFMYFKDRKYYITMEVYSNHAVIYSKNEQHIPSITQADNGKVLTVERGQLVFRNLSEIRS